MGLGFRGTLFQLLFSEALHVVEATERLGVLTLRLLNLKLAETSQSRRN